MAPLATHVKITPDGPGTLVTTTQMPFESEIQQADRHRETVRMILALAEAARLAPVQS